MTQPQNPDAILEANQDRFQKLLFECVADYLPTPTGKIHRQLYVSSRAEAKQNWPQVQADERGEDITGAVLSKLLPHKDNKRSRDENLWINAGGPTATDLRKFYQRLIPAEEWTKVTRAIFEFVRESVENPSQLSQAIHTFGNSGHSKGFASGMLSPILNALRPDDFVVINRKSLDAIQLFSGVRHTSELNGYVQANAGAQALLAKYKDIIAQADTPDLYPSDLFDMFSHWLTLHPAKAREGVGDSSQPLPSVPSPNAIFTKETFSLLEQLHATPTFKFYDKRRSAFKQHLIDPLQDLVRAVAQRLSPEMSGFLETKKNLFSRIPKNDYGNGGAHDNYWGAFYPKGGKRTEDAQLFVYIDKEGFEFGFFLGRNSDNALLERFAERCQKHKTLLQPVLAPILEDFTFKLNLSINPQATEQLRA